jgi:hypothetical protein
MTNRKAIEVLQRNISGCDYELSEAVTMAISAMEFQENYDQFWEEVKATEMKGEETEIFYSGKVFRIREVAQ